MTLTSAQRDVLRRFLASRPIWAPLPGPQADAMASSADIVGYGGAAGGGKTDLVAGLVLTEHQRALVIRREKAQTEGLIQRLAEIVGSTDGLNAQKGIWWLPVGARRLVEFGGLDNPGDERRWQGRPHDLVAFDEVTEMREAQVRFVLGWARTADPRQRERVLMTFNPPTSPEGRWVLRFFGPWLHRGHPRPAAPGELRWFTTIGGEHDVEVPDGRPFVIVNGERVYDFDPAGYRPEDVIRPKSRTFIPARVVDNPYYVRSGYLQQLQALPEPLRSQMMYGDFDAGLRDGAFQIFPTEWVKAAQARWTQLAPVPKMHAVGADIARGGDDKTVIIARHGQWYAQPIRHPGRDTPDGPTAGALIMAAARDRARLFVDVIGVGASPVDWLREREQPVHPVNVANSPTDVAQGGMFEFYNLRTQLMWKLREQLDPANNTGVALPPDDQLAEEMGAVSWSMKGRRVLASSRDEIIENIGRSPDTLSALMLASMDAPDLREVEQSIAAPAQAREHNPLAFDLPDLIRDYDPHG